MNKFNIIAQSQDKNKIVIFDDYDNSFYLLQRRPLPEKFELSRIFDLVNFEDYLKKWEYIKIEKIFYNFEDCLSFLPPLTVKKEVESDKLVCPVCKSYRYSLIYEDDGKCGMAECSDCKKEYHFYPSHIVYICYCDVEEK
jgi:hypothetical protein